ncbi:MAG: hypothetical protein GXY88_03800 [Tissierellia bacterium]|nr:hypothetical protein [Tissierellia bacterium]
MKRFRKNIIHNRIIKMTFLTSAICLLLIGRLYWLQIKNYNTLKIQALKQRGQEISLYPKRGIIYDTNLIPLANRDRESTLFTFKDSIYKDQSLKDFILKYSSLNERELIEYIRYKHTIVDIPLTYTMAPYNDINTLITDRTLRYSKNNILSHVIGYINKSENRGESGIEKVYDDILKNQRMTNSLYVELDDKRNKILNREYVVNQNVDSLEPSGVKLTVDYHIQKIVESVLDQEGYRGAVIVADVKSGDIKALASRPNFNQEEIDEYLDRDDMALYNKAIQIAYPPGSLFKLVVLSAALEEDLNYINRTFYCKGYEQVGNVTIRCNNTGGHGHIDLKEAFSKSCNSAFIQLGKELGSAKIIDMAIRLGLGQKVNIGLLEEVEGNLPKGREIQGPAIGNISIGQGSIETTPIQITNMMMIVANNGIEKGMAIVDGITSHEGYMIKQYNREKERQVLSERTCEILKDCLIDVVEVGTARNIDLSLVGGAGGKTGSAQAVLNRRETIHGWFSGFYPIEEPRYVITVFIEEGMSGSQTAAPVFEKIVKQIHKINR